SGGNLGSVNSDRLDNRATVRDDPVESRRDAVDHDVQEQAGLSGGRAIGKPGSADFTRGVVVRRAAVTALPGGPAKHGSIESGRLIDVVGNKLDVADLAVRARGRHEISLLQPGRRGRTTILRSVRRRIIGRCRPWGADEARSTSELRSYPRCYTGML